MDAKLVIAISIPLSVILVLAAIAVSVLIIRKRKTEKEPTVDDNFYYGDEGNMESISDHSVVDNNDYYEK